MNSSTSEFIHEFIVVKVPDGRTPRLAAIHCQTVSVQEDEMISHQPLSASALHHQGFLEVAVGALHHDSPSSGCTKKQARHNNRYAYYAHIMPIMQIKHTSVGVLRVVQGLSRHSLVVSTASPLHPTLP